MRFTQRHSTLAAITLACLAGAVASATRLDPAPVFYPDDPIHESLDMQDASSVRLKLVSLVYDEALNLFGRPGDADMSRRAMSINTVDEVPDSAWFTNRIGRRTLTADDVYRGANGSDGPAPGLWQIISAKSDGVTPGFTIRDTAGTRWFIKFDPPKWPEMATGAEVAVTRIFHALGYHVPENYVTTLVREQLTLSEEASVETSDGRVRRLMPIDVERLLRLAARNENGTYRAVASRALAGTPVGPFLYAGTRPDDPNDVVPHEHRRELRALRVFAAWTNHADTKSLNTLDTLVTDGDRAFVRHHLIDFGATLGSASIKPRDFDEGHQYIYDHRSTLKGALGLGLYVAPYHFIRYPNFPSVGYFSAEGFVPQRWKPRVPNPAFLRARPDDTFWAARRVMAFTDELIRAAVNAGEYSDLDAAEYIADTLIARRNAIGRTWLTDVNPVIDPHLTVDGTLTFGNAAVEAGVSMPPPSYRTAWFHFDNDAGASTALGPSIVDAADGRVMAPAALPVTPGAFIRVDISAVEPLEPSWVRPVHAYFRRTAGGWTLVGFVRLPDGVAPADADGRRVRR